MEEAVIGCAFSKDAVLSSLTGKVDNAVLSDLVGLLEI
jgi:hypothetical protein